MNRNVITALIRKTVFILLVHRFARCASKSLLDRSSCEFDQVSYHNPTKMSAIGARLLYSLKLHRNKFVTTAFAVLWVLLFGASATYASQSNSHHRLKYRTQLGHDLDGDHIPETASIRYGGHLYEVNIKFTTGRPKLRLKTYVAAGVAGITFQTRDVDNDNKGDLVIISATSIRPIAIWLNQGQATFKKANPWLYGVGRYTGPRLQVRQTTQPETVGNVSIDPLPQVTPDLKYNIAGPQATALISLTQDLRLSDALLSELPPRGPPATTRI